MQGRAEPESVVRLRSRTNVDLDSCIALVEAVHDSDGYPAVWPADLHRFIAPSDEFAAWVAEGPEGQIVGHVALHPYTAKAAMRLARDATHLPDDCLAVVARLLVASARRGCGVGSQLLAAATADAWRRGRRPLLDVATHFTAAIGLYESCGWSRAGEVTMRLRDGSTFQSFVYLSPITPAGT